MYRMFMCGDMFVKLIKILKLIKCMLILLLFDVTFNSLNFVSISLSLVIFEKVTQLAFIGLFSSLVWDDSTSSVAHILWIFVHFW